jgi:hypothetical protein
MDVYYDGNSEDVYLRDLDGGDTFVFPNDEESGICLKVTITRVGENGPNVCTLTDGVLAFVDLSAPVIRVAPDCGSTLEFERVN